MIPSTKTRVPDNTPDRVNQQIREQMRQRIIEVARRGPRAIDGRLAELDQEWDIERRLEAMSSSLTLAGLVLGASVSRKWLLLSGVVQGFFLQHAIQGWCPPLPVMRTMGVRTLDEINEERYALKALRGDFDGMIDESPRSEEEIDEVLAFVSHP